VGTRAHADAGNPRTLLADVIHEDARLAVHLALSETMHIGLEAREALVDVKREIAVKKEWRPADGMPGPDKNGTFWKLTLFFSNFIAV
jgi:hypothetical protein